MTKWLRESLSRIDDVFTTLAEVASGDQNLTRTRRPLRYCFGVEQPIAWTKIFGYDANRYFSDPPFYIEQTLRQKLWRATMFPNDTVPVTLDLPAWLGHYPEYTFVGLDVSFDVSGVPILQVDHPLTRDPDLSHLKSVDFKTSGCRAFSDGMTIWRASRPGA